MRIIFLVLISIVIAFCSNPTDENDYYYLGNEVPVIKGIIRTGEESPEPIGIIGTPNEKGEIELEAAHDSDTGSGLPLYTKIYAPYPNPFNYLTQISFSLNRTANVKIWIVRGKLDESITELKILYSNSYLINTNNINSENYLLNRKLAPGTYQQSFEANNYPDGVYRVYIRVDNQLMWRNLIIINNHF
ncbi:MAG: hypothetical protein IPM32_15425 [Ignavibacteriae bacterium]|nr:hypothetical protein [Ignavibacteriota bacterium]